MTPYLPSQGIQVQASFRMSMVQATGPLPGCRCFKTSLAGLSRSFDFISMVKERGVKLQHRGQLATVEHVELTTLQPLHCEHHLHYKIISGLKSNTNRIDTIIYYLPTYQYSFPHYHHKHAYSLPSKKPESFLKRLPTHLCFCFCFRFTSEYPSIHPSIHPAWTNLIRL
jgi:hypothetical protein